MKNIRILLLSALACLPALALADSDPPATPAAQNQIVVPEVTRRDIQPPKFPSNDFDVGAYFGTYSTQNFGASGVAGLRLGYNITEDFFVQAAVAATNVSDKNYRQILPGGVFPKSTERLSYYNLSAGYNILPGEAFIGTKYAMPFHLYLLAGVGSTTLDQQKHATFNFGTGFRLFFTDHFSMQIDARDHIFSMDLLGQRERTQNLELTVGLTASFF
ncbi:outer membrane beta-barrel protein [Oxalobacteraceae bacterium GrIS 2.11]